MSNRRMSFGNRMRTFWAGMLALAFPVIAIVGTVSTPGVQPAAVAQVTGGGTTGGAASRPVRTFQQVKQQADRVTSAIDALIMWQAFIESGVTGDELARGEAELKIWQERVDDDAIIINKKWVGGKEKRQTEERVNSLIEEFQSLQKRSQTLEAIEKLQEARKVWPENFQIQFFLGFIQFQKEDVKQAQTFFEACKRLRPNSPAVLNNLAASLLYQRQWDRGINELLASVRIQDTKENVQNLVTALAAAPAAERAPRFKAARDARNLLADKHKITGPAGGFLLMGLTREGGEPEASGAEKSEGVIGFGSGFIFSPDGLILTNKHVAGAGTSVMIKFMDGTQRIGEIVVLDDEQDLAIVRVRSDKPFPYVALTKYDNPPDGAKAIVMGYPAPELLGYNVKTTSGPVATGNNVRQTSDVTLDVRVNPGNSGGPVYDEFGNVMAIIAQKTGTIQAQNMDSYGLAISIGRVKQFLKKNDMKWTEAEGEGDPLTIQQVSERNRMATVCILIVGKRDGSK